MNKYILEGGADFFAELYKSLDIEEAEEDDNICLITNEPLSDKHVILNCGHKFNYIPLYHDILNHKKKFNNMEGTTSKLNTNELRCPYCRKKQIGLLPYYQELGLQKVSGVNFYDPNREPLCNNYKLHKCEYESLNQNYDPNKPESITNKKTVQCYSNYATKITGFDSEPNIYGDDKSYCYKHKKQVIKDYKLKEKEKMKELKIQEKALVKAAKQKAKEEEKQLNKKVKESSKKIKSENVVLGPSIIGTENTGCVQILKSGPNKGNPCGCKIFADNLCKRHALKN